MTPIQDYNRKATQTLHPEESLYLFELGTRSFQAAHGLKVDGWCGPKTQAVLHSQSAPPVLDVDLNLAAKLCGVPIPHGYQEIEQVYGKFTYTENPYKRGGILIPKKWRYANISGVRLHTGKRVWINNVCAEEVPVLFEEACRVSGLTPQRIGSFVPRHKVWNPSKSLSTHSWAISLDMDAAFNKWGNHNSMMHQNPAFVKVWTDAGWVWGGNWPDPYCDPMHFQRATGA